MKMRFFIFIVLFYQSCTAMVDNSANKSFLSAITGGDTVEYVKKYLQGKQLNTAIEVKVNGTQSPRFLFRSKQDPIPMKFSTNLTSYAALDCNVEVLKYLITQAPAGKNPFSLIQKDGAIDEADIWDAWFMRCFYEGKFHVSQRKQAIETGKIIVSYVKESDDKWLQLYFKGDASALHAEIKKGMEKPEGKSIDQDIALLNQRVEEYGDELVEIQKDPKTKEEKIDAVARRVRVVRELAKEFEGIKKKGAEKVDYQLMIKNIEKEIKKSAQERDLFGAELSKLEDAPKNSETNSKMDEIAQSLRDKWEEVNHLEAKKQHVNQLILDRSSVGVIDEQEIDQLMLLYILLGDKKTLKLLVDLKKNIYFDMPYFGDASSLHVAFALGDTDIFNYILEQAKSKLDDNALSAWFNFCLEHGWFTMGKVKSALAFTKQISDSITVPATASFMIRGLQIFLTNKSKFISSVLKMIPPKRVYDKLAEKDKDNLSDAIDLYALLAVISGDWDMLQKLLDKKIEFDVLTLKGFNDYTLLHLATFVGQKEIVDQLVKTPFFDGEERDANGSTPGKIAQEYGYAKIAESILKLKKQREAEKKQSTEEQKQKDEKIFDEKLEEQRAKNRKDLVLPRLAKAIQNLKDKLAELNEKAAEFATKQPQVKQNAEA